jgi:HAD superfamily hydrolase (TIGR01490 family)
MINDPPFNTTLLENDRRSRKAAFFDVDGTLTSGHTYRGFLEYFRAKGLRRGTHMVYMGYHLPLYFLRRLGLISESRFRGAWSADMAWFVRGYTIEAARTVWDYSVEYLDKFWRDDTCTILNQHLKDGDLVLLVSSGPLPLLQRTAQELGIEHVIGTRFEVKDGRYTGRSLRPVCTDKFKSSLTKEYLQDKGLSVDLASSFAYADSIVDLPLLEMVGNPVVVYPDAYLEEIALQRGWQIYPSAP